MASDRTEETLLCVINLSYRRRFSWIRWLGLIGIRTRKPSRSSSNSAVDYEVTVRFRDEAEPFVSFTYPVDVSPDFAIARARTIAAERELWRTDRRAWMARALALSDSFDEESARHRHWSLAARLEAKCWVLIQKDLLRDVAPNLDRGPGKKLLDLARSYAAETPDRVAQQFANTGHSDASSQDHAIACEGDRIAYIHNITRSIEICIDTAKNRTRGKELTKALDQFGVALVDAFSLAWPLRMPARPQLSAPAREPELRGNVHYIDFKR
ncbi:hypothetical protein [Microvirga massiliensis]|uniref:hypothetical protein n=1 Tax=Microvirga massiliensis TaxID=1033741 RepID=UPI00062B672D|nr:hypothetical protein [Microvirga massiliensis]